MKKILLGSILHMTKGKKPKEQAVKQEADFLPYVDIKAFEKRIIDNYASPEKCLLCQDGDVLIVCDGARSGLVGRAMAGVVGSTLALISADGCSNNYLFYFLQSLYVLLNTKQKGTGTPHLNPDLLKKAQLVVPPLPEQERIVAQIEELFSQLDAAVAELKSVKEKLAIYRQAVLKEAFEKYNKGMVQLKHIAVSRLGKMLDKSKNTGNTHKYLRNINVRWLGFDTTDLLDIKIEDYEVEKFSIAFDDLIMCEGGEPGRCAVWKNKESICFQKALHRIRFLDDSIPEFYMYLFYYYAQTGVLKPYFTGSGIKHLTGEKLETVLVPKAPRDEQNSTVNYIEKKLSICNNIEQNVDTALQQAAALRQSILKQAFEGNL